MLDENNMFNQSSRTFNHFNKGGESSDIFSKACQESSNLFKLKMVCIKQYLNNERKKTYNMNVSLSLKNMPN